MPLWLQKGLFGTLANIGAILGYKKQLYKYYKGTIEPGEKVCSKRQVVAFATA